MWLVLQKEEDRLTWVTKHDIKTTMLSLQLSEDKYIGLLYRSIAIGEIANLFKFISFSPPSISFGFILINIQRKLYSKTSNTFARTKAFCNNIETSSYSNPINQAEKPWFGNQARNLFFLSLTKFTEEHFFVAEKYLLIDFLSTIAFLVKKTVQSITNFFWVDFHDKRFPWQKRFHCWRWYARGARE